MSRKSWGLIGVLAIGVFALGAASRFVNISRSDPDAARTADVLTIGVVANTSGGERVGADYVRGIRLWLRRVHDSGGIPYNSNLHAAVRLIVHDDHGRPDQAGKLANQLMRQGVSVIFGPPDPEELTSVADALGRSDDTLLFSPIPRPSTVPTTERATFLYRPRIGDLRAALDVVAIRGPKGKDGEIKRRVVLLAEPGEWALRARSGQLLAQERAITAPLVTARSTSVDPALDSVQGRVDAIITFAPFRQALRWFTRSRRRSHTPWILVADDPRPHSRSHDRTPWL